jgi:hypothetical protein
VKLFLLAAVAVAATESNRSILLAATQTQVPSLCYDLQRIGLQNACRECAQQKILATFKYVYYHYPIE